MRIQSVFGRVGQFVLVFGSVLAIGKVHATFIGNYDLTESSRFAWILTYSATCSLLAYSFGLPEQGVVGNRWKSALAASASSCLLFIGVQTVIAQIVFPRFLLALSIPVVFATLFIWSSLIVRFARIAADRERVLLIFDVIDSATVRSDVDFHTELPCVIAAVLNDTSQVTSDELMDLCETHTISLIVLSDEARNNAAVFEAVTRAHESGVRVRSLLDFYNQWLGKVPVRELPATALLFDVRELHHVGYARASRLIDLASASVGLVVLVIAIPFVLLGNTLGNRGPLFYSQDRIGRAGVGFRIHKFRSMRPGASNGEWTQRNDSRVTAFGRFLRASHLDELPQVLNILRGDLSIVGPRPEQPQYVEHLAKTIPYYNSRHLVRPGLTGWAQVNYPYGADEIDAFEKLQYEFWYLQHQSLTTDLRIIARTFRHVLGFKGQ